VESLTLLIYGINISPHKHLHKLANKFINRFMKVRQTIDFTDEHYYEVIVEEQSLISAQRNYITAPVIPVHKNYLQNLLKVYSNLNATVTLCTEEHEHPLVCFNDIEYEGYCYYELNSDKKILFFGVLDTKHVISLPKQSNPEKLMLEYIKTHFETLHN